MPHEAHGEDEVEDSEDGMQPEKVIAGGGGDTTCHQGWAPKPGWGCRGWARGPLTVLS